MKSRKSLVFLLGVILVFGGLCASCTSSNTDTGTKKDTTTNVDTDNTGSENADMPAWQKYADEEPITLDWYINYSWYTTPWGVNAVSQSITEETGVSVEFITPMGNETEKLNSLMTSDSLPDLITLGWWEPQVNQMISEGTVYALNELADEYDMYFYEVTDPETVDWYTKEDGNIYAYPNSSYSPNDLKENDNIGSNQTFLVRKDIYEAIGSPDMTTIEGFQNAVRKAAEMFPEINGEPLIPVGAHAFEPDGNVSFDKYLMNFLAVPWEKNGQMYDRITDPEYIAWLKAFRELGEEGYLANDIFLDSRTQMEEKIAQGRYFCMLYQYTDLLAQQRALYGENPDSIYIAVDGPKNSRGDDPVLPVTSINGWTVTLISKNCEHPDRAIAFIDYLMSEHGQKMIYLGVEGVTYDVIDGKPVVKEEVQEILDTDRTTYDRLYGGDDAYWMFQDNVMQLQWEQETPEAIAQLKEWSYPYVAYTGIYDIFLPTGSEEVMMDENITQLWSETLPRLLLAESEEEFDRIFEDFIAEREAMGFETVQAAKTELVNEAKDKLGIE